MARASLMNRSIPNTRTMPATGIPVHRRKRRGQRDKSAAGYGGRAVLRQQQD